VTVLPRKEEAEAERGGSRGHEAAAANNKKLEADSKPRTNKRSVPNDYVPLPTKMKGGGGGQQILQMAPASDDDGEESESSGRGGNTVEPVASLAMNSDISDESEVEATGARPSQPPPVAAPRRTAPAASTPKSRPAPRRRSSAWDSPVSSDISDDDDHEDWLQRLVDQEEEARQIKTSAVVPVEEDEVFEGVTEDEQSSKWDISTYVLHQKYYTFPDTDM
jgi:hypothetical protein